MDGLDGSTNLPQVGDPKDYREAADRTTVRSEDYTIEQVEPSALPEERLEAAARLRQAVDHERVPEDPLTPLEVYVRRMRIKPPSQWSAVFMARVPDGEVAGIGYVGYGLDDLENAHLRWTDVPSAPGIAVEALAVRSSVGSSRRWTARVTTSRSSGTGAIASRQAKASRAAWARPLASR